MFNPYITPEARPSAGNADGLNGYGIFSDPGELLLLGALLILYMDSRDEDFLILLAVMVLSRLPGLGHFPS